MWKWFLRLIGLTEEVQPMLPPPASIQRDQESKTWQAVRVWEVRWQSRHGEYSSSLSPEVEVFTTLEQAKQFEQAIKDAFALLRHRGTGTEVSVQERKR